MKTRLPYFNKRSTSGFTLVELLVAIAISGISISLAGTALVSIMQSQQKSATEVAQRTNLNRALDFMADEVRMSKSISTAADKSIVSGCGTAKGVFTLAMPSSSNVNYYIQSFSSCSSKPWSGPAAIYREQGTNVQLLVDGVRTPPATESCALGMKGANGFYACINNTRNANLYLYGKITDAYGNEIKTGSGSNAVQIYSVSSQVTARSQ